MRISRLYRAFSFTAGRAWRRLRTALQGRRVGSSHHFRLGGRHVVHVPLRYWIKFAWMPITLLGLQQPTRMALFALRIDSVGELLLHTQEELGRLPELALLDTLTCLGRRGLRLPTERELAEARARDDWKELRVRHSDPRPMRVATVLVPFLLTKDLDALLGRQPAFFARYGLVTLGDVLHLTEAELRERWLSYVTVVFYDTKSEEYKTEGVREIIKVGADGFAEETLKWLKSAGLQLRS